MGRDEHPGVVVRAHHLTEPVPIGPEGVAAVPAGVGSVQQRGPRVDDPVAEQLDRPALPEPAPLVLRRDDLVLLVVGEVDRVPLVDGEALRELAPVLELGEKLPRALGAVHDRTARQADRAETREHLTECLGLGVAGEGRVGIHDPPEGSHLTQLTGGNAVAVQHHLRGVRELDRPGDARRLQCCASREPGVEVVEDEHRRSSAHRLFDDCSREPGLPEQLVLEVPPTNPPVGTDTQRLSPQHRRELVETLDPAEVDAGGDAGRPLRMCVGVEESRRHRRALDVDDADPVGLRSRSHLAVAAQRLDHAVADEQGCCRTSRGVLDVASEVRSDDGDGPSCLAHGTSSLSMVRAPAQHPFWRSGPAKRWWRCVPDSIRAPARGPPERAPRRGSRALGRRPSTSRASRAAGWRAAPGRRAPGG